MKRSILISAVLWLFFISAAHVHLNVGWDQVEESVAQMFGKKRDKMIVGFLPVT
jgi:hypothetical protein